MNGVITQGTAKATKAQVQKLETYVTTKRAEDIETLIEGKKTMIAEVIKIAPSLDTPDTNGKSFAVNIVQLDIVQYAKDNHKGANVKTAKEKGANANKAIEQFPALLKARDMGLMFDTSKGFEHGKAEAVGDVGKGAQYNIEKNIREALNGVRIAMVKAGATAEDIGRDNTAGYEYSDKTIKQGATPEQLKAFGGLIAEQLRAG